MFKFLKQQRGSTVEEHGSSAPDPESPLLSNEETERQSTESVAEAESPLEQEVIHRSVAERLELVREVLTDSLQDLAGGDSSDSERLAEVAGELALLEQHGANYLDILFHKEAFRSGDADRVVSSVSDLLERIDSDPLALECLREAIAKSGERDSNDAVEQIVRLCAPRLSREEELISPAIEELIRSPLTIEQVFRVLSTLPADHCTDQILECVWEKMNDNSPSPVPDLCCKFLLELSPGSEFATRILDLSHTSPSESLRQFLVDCLGAKLSGGGGWADVAADSLLKTAREDSAPYLRKSACQNFLQMLNNERLERRIRPPLEKIRRDDPAPEVRAAAGKTVDEIRRRERRRVEEHRLKAAQRAKEEENARRRRNSSFGSSSRSGSGWW